MRFRTWYYVKECAEALGISKNEILSDITSKYDETISQTTGSLIPGLSTEGLVIVLVLLVAIPIIGFAIKQMLKSGGSVKTMKAVASSPAAKEVMKQVVGTAAKMKWWNFLSFL